MLLGTGARRLSRSAASPFTHRPDRTMSNHLSLTAARLDEYVGKDIARICPVGFGEVKDKWHHCAHFVGHALGLNHAADVGATCASMIWKGDRSRSACLRVNELFNRAVAEIDAADDKGCLIFCTVPDNAPKPPVGRRIMGTKSRKHVGIYLDGSVWHYGNTGDKVKCESLDDFTAAFQRNYGADAIFFYGRFPTAARFIEFKDLKGSAAATPVTPPASPSSRTRPPLPTPRSPGPASTRRPR